MKERISLIEYQNTIDNLEMTKNLLKNRNIKRKYQLTKQINQMKNELDNIYTKSTEFTNLEKSYNRLIKETAFLLTNMNITEPVPILSLYTYLIKNGYLSLNHHFTYNKNVDDCLYLFGTNVIYGEGVCRHITTFLTDIYKEIGYESYNIAMVSKDTETLSRQEYNYEESNIQESKIQKVKNKINNVYGTNFNHLVTLVNNLNESLIVDPTNDIVFYINDHYQIIPIIGKKQIMIGKYLPLFNKEEKGLLKDFLSITKQKTINTVQNNYNKTWNIATQNKNVLNCFYKNNEDLYQEINTKRKILVKEFKRYIDR